MGLRICDITMFYPTVNSGGVKRYILDKKKHCLEHTEHVHCTIIPDVMNAKVENGPNDIMYKIKSPALPWNPSYRLLHSFKSIKKALEDFQPDVIEVGCPYLVPKIVRKVYRGKKNRPIMVGFYHADFPRADIYQLAKKVSTGFANFAQRRAEKFATKVYNHMDHTIVTGPTLKKRLNKLDINNVQILPFGVDTNLFRPSGSVPTSLDGPLKLLFVGRLATEKRILPCVDRIHELVRKHGVKLELTIVGSGYLKDRLVKKIDGAPYIKQIDFISSKAELAKQFSAHDLLLVTNPYETFCIGALESMACGTPVLACNGSSGVETVVNENTGFLLGTDLDELIPFLKNVDRHELLRMRKNVRQHIKDNFDIRVCYGRVFDFYERIAGYQPTKQTETRNPLEQKKAKLQIVP